jgi:hypothetical protein
MKALLVYESMFGNTEKVARAVAEGMQTHMDVDVVGVGDAPTPVLDHVDVLVVGGPTHAFSMTRANTRSDAARQGAHAPTGVGIREWIDGLRDGPHSELVAAFDTRVRKVRHLPGSAARSATKALHRHGYRIVVRPESFYVDDVSGPLFDGELERARAWGEQLGTICGSRAAAK